MNFIDNSLISYLKKTFGDISYELSTPNNIGGLVLIGRVS